MPEKIHIGTITRFMMPETPSIVRGRAAVSRPRPLNASAPSSEIADEQQQRSAQRHAEHEVGEQQQRARFGDQEDQPRRELRAEQVAAPRRRGDQPLQQVAVARDDQREADAPHAGAHEVHAEQARHQEVDVARAGLGDLRAPGVKASARPAARCSAASTASRAARLSGCVGS